MNSYVVNSSESLFEILKSEYTKEGVTLTAPGFYGSQGRVLRMELALPGFNDSIEKFGYDSRSSTVYDMLLFKNHLHISHLTLNLFSSSVHKWLCELLMNKL